MINLIFIVWAGVLGIASAMVLFGGAIVNSTKMQRTYYVLQRIYRDIIIYGIIALFTYDTVLFFFVNYFFIVKFGFIAFIYDEKVLENATYTEH